MAVMRCEQLREVAPDVALGLLTGEERAWALAHLEECEACRADVGALAVAADEVLLAAPEATPPAGFDSRVLAALAERRSTGEGVPATPAPGGAEGRRRRRRPRPRSVVALAAAAVLVVVVGLAAVVTLGDVDPPSDSVAGSRASADMVTGRGRVVGEVTMTGDEPVVIDVDVPEWEALVEQWGEPASGSYWLAVESRDGSRTMRPVPAAGDAGDDRGDGGDGWSLSVDVAADEVAAVSVVDGEGRVWCSGQFAV